MPSIQDAYNWAIDVCNQPNVGYSQTYRDQRTVNGITYYDCSSFIWYALIAGGFGLVGIWGTWPFTTSTMASVLKKLGFVKHEPSDEWKPGDILIRNGHTEMAFDTTRTMGAHTSTVPLDQQVSINANDGRGTWAELWRWETGATNEWIKGNRYLGIGEMQNNATIIFSYLTTKGWTASAISGMLGNMQKESSINPGIWQNLNPNNPSLGWGLVQWTPSTNFTNWASANGYQADDGNAQLIWIDTVTTQVGQWIPTDIYPETFGEFKISTMSPEYLADCFLKNFERPGDLDQPDRQEYARYWYDWYNNGYVPPTNPPENGGEWKRSMPIWFYSKRLI